MLVDQNNSRRDMQVGLDYRIYVVWYCHVLWNMECYQHVFDDNDGSFLKTHGQVSESVYKQFECP